MSNYCCLPGKSRGNSRDIRRIDYSLQSAKLMQTRSVKLQRLLPTFFPGIRMRYIPALTTASALFSSSLTASSRVAANDA